MLKNSRYRETVAEVKRFTGRFPSSKAKNSLYFYKEKALLRPDFTAKEATEWIEFFWDFQIDS